MTKINFANTESTTVRILPGDPDFTITDNFCIVQRAAIEISNKCPHGYNLIIAEAISRGWIKPVAYIKKTEQVWNALERI